MSSTLPIFLICVLLIFSFPLGFFNKISNDHLYFEAEVMKSLHIPKGVKRVLFRTSNTDRFLFHFLYLCRYLLLIFLRFFEVN